MDSIKMKRPELSDFGLSQDDVVSIKKYDALISKRKEIKEFFYRDPLGFLFVHSAFGIFVFIIVFGSAWKFKQAVLAAMIPCIWTFSKMLFLLLW